MYVCLCNALTDKRVKHAVATTGAQRPGEVYEACGCRVQCGKCVQTLLRLVRDHTAQADNALQQA